MVFDIIVDEVFVNFIVNYYKVVFNGEVGYFFDVFFG